MVYFLRQNRQSALQAPIDDFRIHREGKRSTVHPLTEKEYFLPSFQ